MTQLTLPTPDAPDTAWNHLPLWARQLTPTRPHAAHRAARPTSCPTCREPLLVGLDDDTCAATVRTDPTPLDTTGEALALIAGRSTYRLRRNGTHFELDRRTHHDIAHQPAGHPHHDVLPAHHCGHPLPAIPTVHAALPAATWKDLPHDPPF